MHPSTRKIAERIREDPYRFLVCADKFQTGYDEPLLHTMYVDKTLSGIIRAFNDLFGYIVWQDADRVRELITETIPAKVAADTAFKNARQNSDKENARIEHDKALVRVMTSVMKDDTELFKQFMDNQSFKRWMSDAVFGLAYTQAGRE